jgi:flavin reductase (DIM6/NTAB) family NADH-FMN oxidoreductase RutF
VALFSQTGFNMRFTSMLQSFLSILRLQRVYSSTASSYIEYDLSPGSKHYTRAYQLLSSIIVPRPIALISTLNDDGSLNVAPYSFFNCMGSDPPLVAFASARKKGGTIKDTATNIIRDRQFTVNLVDEAMADAMNICGAELPYSESEILYSKLTSGPTTSSSPRIMESPASLECTEHSTLVIGSSRVIIGIVSRIHLRSDLVSSANIDKPRIQREHLKLIGRMQAPGYYCRTTDAFKMIVPEVQTLIESLDKKEEGIRTESEGEAQRRKM